MLHIAVVGGILVYQPQATESAVCLIIVNERYRSGLRLTNLSKQLLPTLQSKIIAWRHFCLAIQIQRHERGHHR